MPDQTRRIRRVFDETSHFIGLLAPDGTLIEANRTSLEFAQVAATDVLGKLFWETPWWTHSPAQQKRLRHAISEAANGQFVRFEAHHPAPDGSVRHLDASLKPVFGKNRHVEYLVIEGRDITERRQAEDALQETEERLRAALSASDTGTWRWDPRTNRETRDASFNRMLGLEPVDSTQGVEDFLSHVHPEDRAAVEEAIRRSLDTRQPYSAEFRIICPNGETRWLRERGRVFCDGKDQNIHMTGAAVDITEKRQSEEALRESRTMLQLVLDTIEARVFWKDLDSVYLGCNRRFADDAGLRSSEEIVGRDDYSLWSALAELYRSDDRRVMQTGEPRLDYEEPLTTPAGDRLWVSTSKIPLRNRKGEVIGVLGTYTDITERRRAERRRDQLEAQLRQTQKLQAVSQLAAGVAHDFNSLLTVILGNAELLHNNLVGDGDKPTAQMHVDHLARIVRSVETGQALVKKLLAFGRARHWKPARLDLKTVMSKIRIVIESMLGSSIRLELLQEADLWPIHGDATSIEQVVMNLALNARDAMPEGGELVIESTNVELDETYAAAHPEAREGRHVLVTVRDAGTGIEEEDLASIFEPFFTKKAMDKGSGLGLSIVHGIVAQTGGHIVVDSVLGRGTTFRLYFPAAE